MWNISHNYEHNHSVVLKSNGDFNIYCMPDTKGSRFEICMTSRVSGVNYFKVLPKEKPV